ncbi:MAG: ABC transporter permease subunit [Verrucomicrobiaceae bacterium]|nr:ABC transporter permease subunit [Verrucomicrobiaceae bacterium]
MRKRTYMGFVAFFGLEAVFLTLFYIKGGDQFFKTLITRQGEGFDEYFSALTLGHFILRISMLLLGALFLALVTGDIVAKESEDGHLRLILARPISRLRLLALKFAASMFYSVVSVLLIACSTLVLGVIMRGWGGGMFVFAPEMSLVNFFDWNSGLIRFAIGAALLGFSMSVVSALGFFFSCMKIKPAAATIAALSYILVDFIMNTSHMMDSYGHLLLTRYMACWIHVFADPVPIAQMARDMTVIVGFNLSLFVLGAAIFAGRDLKS